MQKSTYKKLFTRKLAEEDNIKIIDKLIDALKDNDDVQEIYHNWVIPENFEL